MAASRTPSVILATAGYDHSIRFWEASSGICYRTLQYPDSQINKLEVSPDKRYIAAAGNPHVRLFDINSSSPHAVISFDGHTNNVTTIGFHKEGKWLFTGSEDKTVKIWDLRAPTCQRDYESKAAVNTVALHPNQAELISGDQNGMIHVWDLTTNNCSKRAVPENHVPIRSITTALDGSIAVAGTNTGRCHVWYLDQEDQSDPALAHPSPASLINVPAPSTPSTENIPSLSNNVGSGNSTSGNTPPIQQQQQQQAAAAARAVSASIGSSSISSHRDISAASISSSLITQQANKAPQAGSHATVATSNNLQGNSLADAPGGSTASQIRFSHSFVAHQDAYILKCLLSPDARYLATTSSDKRVNIWNVPSMSLERSLVGHQRWVWDCVFSVDSAYLITGSSDNTARLWEVGQGEMIRAYKGHTKAVTAVALSDTPV